MHSSISRAASFEVPRISRRPLLTFFACFLSRSLAVGISILFKYAPLNWSYDREEITSVVSRARWRRIIASLFDVFLGGNGRRPTGCFDFRFGFCRRLLGTTSHAQRRQAHHQRRTNHAFH